MPRRKGDPFKMPEAGDKCRICFGLFEEHGGKTHQFELRTEEDERLR